MSQQPEWHPWLKMFTILGIVGGAIFTYASFVSLSEKESGSGQVVLLFLVLGPGSIVESIYTLYATDFYRRWRGVPLWKKLIAVLPIYVGLNVAVALFLITPFTRFITDAIGGGLGMSRRE